MNKREKDEVLLEQTKQTLNLLKIADKIKEEKQMTLLQKDAARYRYLRDTQRSVCRDWSGEDGHISRVGVVGLLFICDGLRTATAPDPEELDAYMDSAMLLFPEEVE